MLTESIELAENITNETFDFNYTAKNKGAGYDGKIDTTTTVQYLVQEFSGSIKMQGTLELYPGDDDWVDINSTLIDDDSTSADDSYTNSFSGNFVWLRAAYTLTDGTILSIRYNL